VAVVAVATAAVTVAATVTVVATVTVAATAVEVAAATATAALRPPGRRLSSTTASLASVSPGMVAAAELAAHHALPGRRAIIPCPLKSSSTRLFAFSHHASHDRMRP
jgi:ABC-type spermidine/putrescine transport system permease subunit II